MNELFIGDHHKIKQTCRQLGLDRNGGYQGHKCYMTFEEQVRGQRSAVRGQRSSEVVRGQRSEVRGQRPEARGQRSEARGQR